MAVARTLGIRVFLEGVEVDIVSADMKCGVNMPASASIEIPSADSAHRLLPRTLVHVFHLDASFNTRDLPLYPPVFSQEEQAFAEAGRIKQASREAEKGHGTAHLKDISSDFRHWKLLFVGEITGYRYKNSAVGRTIIINCTDCSTYWQNSRLYWGATKLSSHTYKRAIFIGSTQVTIGRSKADSYRKLYKILNRKVTTHPGIKGLLGSCISLLEVATGVYQTETSTKFRGINDFNTQAELRLKLSRMIAAAPGDDSSAVFIKAPSFKRYLRKISKATNSTASYFDLMSLLLSKCYHNWASVLAPPYFPTGTHKAWGDVKLPPEPSKEPATKAKGRIRGMRGHLKELSKEIRKQWEEANLLYANKSHKEEEPLADGESSTSSKAVQRGADEVFFAKSVQAAVVTYLSTWIVKAQSFGGGKDNLSALIAGVTQDLQEENITDKALAERRKNQIVSGYRVYYRVIAVVLKTHGKTPGTHVTSDYRHILREVRKTRRLLGAGLGIHGQRVGKEVKLRQKLHCFMLMPDLYMVPPPKCNVLFPNQVTSMEYNREFFSEITRLALFGRKDSGRGKKKNYFAPNSNSLHSLNSASDKQVYTDSVSAAVKGHSYIMGHEKYSGIIPAVMGLGDNEAMNKINTKTMAELKKQLGDEKYKQAAGTAQNGPEQHMARAANYMFFSNRYDGRSVRVNCRFTPQLVPGMPCLVIDPVRGAKGIGGLHTDMQELMQLDKDLKTLKNSSGASGMSDAISSVLGGDKTDLPDKKVRLQTRINTLRARIAARTKQGRSKGVHFLGLIAGINHAFDSSGGAATIVMLHKCRTHIEGNDVFVGEPEDAGARIIHQTSGKTAAKTAQTEDKRETWYLPLRKGTEPGQWYVVRGIGKVFDINNGTRWTRPKGTSRKGTTFYASNRPKGRSFQESELPSTVISYNLGGYLKWIPCKVYKVTTLEASKATQTPTSLSFELTATPPWFSPIYHPDLIGRKFYNFMTGCNSIMDGELLDRSDAVEVPSYGKAFTEFDKKYGDLSSTSKKEDLKKLLALADESDVANMQKHLGDQVYTTGGPAGGAEFIVPNSVLNPGSTVYERAEALAEMYLTMTEADIDVDRWVDFYTSRRFATMADMFGASSEKDDTKKVPHHVIQNRDMDLTTLLDPNGYAYGDNSKNPVAIKDYKGFNEGFHTFAFGGMEEGTIISGWEPLPDFENVDTTKVNKLRTLEKFVDPRKVRRKRVLAYARELVNISSAGGTEAGALGSHSAELAGTSKKQISIDM